MERQAVPESAALIEPLGGRLKERFVFGAERAVVVAQARHMPSWDLTPAQRCHVEMVLNGAFSPLEGFMGRIDYDSVLEQMRLADGTLWPIPVTLDVSETFAESLSLGQRVALRDPEGVLIAVLETADLWCPAFARKGRRYRARRMKEERGRSFYVGGALIGIEAPTHYDFRSLRRTPRQVRELLSRWGRRRVAAFQTAHPMHRFEVEWTRQAVADLDASLLIQAIVEMSRARTFDYFPRVRCHEHVMRHYPMGRAVLNLLLLARQNSRTREAIGRIIIARNFGCSHFLLDPKRKGEEGGHELLRSYGEELAVEMIECSGVKHDRISLSTIRAQERSISSAGVAVEQVAPTLSDSEVVCRLRSGQKIPDDYTYPDVLEELREMYRPRHERGFAIFFTGLSGAGKSTLANAVLSRLRENDRRKVTLLDGDLVRKRLSSELGFSKEHRDLNVLRIGFVASEIAKHGGIAICAPIAPYAEIRREVREMIEPAGGFVEIHVATSLAICEQRDRKGLYAKARAGLLKGFTGIDDPYEAPISPELSIDTAGCSPDEGAEQVLGKLAALGYFRHATRALGGTEGAELDSALRNRSRGSG